jgi:polyisoprenoid-binding protein YceI
MMKQALPLLALSAFTLLSPRAAPAAEYHVKAGGPNKVVFISTAPMEKFQGKTSHLEGTINVDPTTVGDSVTVHLEVDLATLDTGIAKRDQHMREEHLQTDKYPKAVFDGATLVHAPGLTLLPGRPVGFDAQGTFNLHGVSRRIWVHIDATYQKDQDQDAIEFSTEFPVMLSDYQISLPQFLFLKLAETQDVHVHGVAVLSK